MYNNLDMKKILLLLLTLFILAGCANKQEQDIYDSVEDFANKKVGTASGSYAEANLDKYVPNANKVIFSTISEMPVALNANKIDGFVIDEPIAKTQKLEDGNIDYIVIPDSILYAGFIFSDNLDQSIINDFNQFVKEEKESGYIDALDDKWINNPSFDNTSTIYEFTPTKQTLKIITIVDQPPYAFQKEDKIEGFCIELINYFCYRYGYGLEITATGLDGLLSAVASGKYDIGAAEISITEERQKNINFSEPIHGSSAVVVFKKQSSKGLEYDSVDKINDLRMGCMSGSIFDLTIRDKIKYSDLIYFNSRAELIMGLKQNKIDAYLADEPVAKIVCNENNDIGYIKEVVDVSTYGICFSENASNIRLEFNEYLKQISENGFKKQLEDKWFVDDAIDKKIEDIELTGENGVINCCTTPDAAPFSFFKDNDYEGYEVELIKNFAKEYGYSLNISSTSFDALISSIASNKFDVAFNGVYITPERELSIDFSDPTYKANVVIVVRNGVNSSTSFLDTLKNKIYSTFIEEERYKLILSGIGVTLLISFCSILFGTIFAFLFYLISRKVNLLKKVFDAIAYIVAGLPVIVLLMIFFYIIFASSSISGTIISIMGFSLIFACSVYSMLKTGVGAIDKGQFEGALALGYTDNRTLFKFIFPQAFRIIMPSYKGEIISLIKSSSVVGYITVQDITRASDIIRSRTYDAFFPLIVTAIIYFILAYLLTKLADYLQNKYIPNEKTKEEILRSIGQNKK